MDGSTILWSTAYKNTERQQRQNTFFILHIILVLSDDEALRTETILVRLDELLALVFAVHDDTIVSGLRVERGQQDSTGQDNRGREERLRSVILTAG